MSIRLPYFMHHCLNEEGLPGEGKGVADSWRDDYRERRTKALVIRKTPLPHSGPKTLPPKLAVPPVQLNKMAPHIVCNESTPLPLAVPADMAQTNGKDGRCADLPPD
jgi:hypothetical protein